MRDERFWVISQDNGSVRVMSALPPEADMLIVGINVCYVPRTDFSDHPRSLLSYYTPGACWA